MSYLIEAMGYAEAGIKPPKEQGEFELPDELLEALESDSDPLNVEFNHPFFYLIQNVETGEILFLGRVMDPSQ